MTDATRKGDSYVQDEAKATSSDPAPRFGAGLRRAFASVGGSRRFDGSGAQSGRGVPTSPRILIASALALLAFALPAAASAAPPSVTIDEVTEVGFNSAKVIAHVDPGDNESAYRFEFVTQEKFEASEWAEASSTFFEFLPGGSGSNEVTGQLSLSPGKTYHLRMFITDFSGGEATVLYPSTFATEAVNPPEAQIDAASSIDGDSAHLSGTVNSGGTGAGEKAGSYSFSCSPGCPSAEGPHNFQAEGFADGADHAVQAEAEGLLPNTEYTVTLSAQNAAGQESDQTIFTTDAIGPGAITAFVAPRSTTTARLNAYIVPNNSPTTYFFQYGSADCSANPCTSVPISEDASVEPTDLESHIVSQEIEGLSEASTYHYRVVAENSAGTTAGVDKTFETRSAAEMVLAPRGYELVNPPDKGNQDIRPIFEAYGLGDGPESSGNAPDREAIAWSVFAGAPGGTTGAQNPFLSTRGPDGWNTISMVGPADKQVGSGEKAFRFISASADLSRFILTTSEGVLTGSDVTIVRADRAGNQEALTTFPNQQNELSRSVETSEDAQHVLLRDPDSGKLYDFGSGTPEEVGLMPDGSSPPCGASRFFAWDGRPSSYHWIARADASRVFFESNGPGCSGVAIYVRNRETEETTEVAPGSTFIRASRDGKRAVFISGLALTGEDPNSTGDLYMWSEISGNKCLTCSVPNAEIGSVEDSVEVSEDLSRTYFRSPNALVPAEHKGGGTYVAMADGSVHYAGKIPVFPTPYVRGFTRLTPDGRGALFSTNQRVTDDDAPGGLYYYDDVTRSIECISCIPGGVTKLGPDSAYELSRDGHTATFTTKERLLPSDVNGGADIYQWHNGKLGLITDGVTKFPGGQPGGGESFGAPMVRGISADGRDIFFSLVGSLTGFEHDGLSNLYDARIGGGFPPPSAAVHCDGDACQGGLEVPPASVRSASSTFSGNGNVAGTGRPRCRKAKVRRKGRCVSKRTRCRKQEKAKRRCAKQHTHKRSQRNDRGGSK
jgi:hypothetical protein